MVELIIAFLISIGWLNPINFNTTIVTETSLNKYGIVSVDDVGDRSAVVFYNVETRSFQLIP